MAAYPKKRSVGFDYLQVLRWRRRIDYAVEMVSVFTVGLLISMMVAGRFQVKSPNDLPQWPHSQSSERCAFCFGYLHAHSYYSWEKCGLSVSLPGKYCSEQCSRYAKEAHDVRSQNQVR
jgi:hypothetical protein